MTLDELKEQIHEKSKRIGRERAISQIRALTKCRRSPAEKLASGTYPSGMHPLAIEALEKWVGEEDEEEDLPPAA